jgi:predicted house-cleaning noncanonical NTP pyrophosphatase (MazG superfamily)
MAKKLADIQSYIESENENFHEYFHDSISLDITSFISKLQSNTNVFIFSGIIRDYFINKRDNKFRDIDLIIEDDLVLENLFKNLKFKKNSFGGYKIEFENIYIDLWVIKKTWALNQGQLKFEFGYINALPKTTFFNFSSILYSLNRKEFLIGKDFLKFIRDKEIELVLDKNPYPELCIVNSFYYSDKLNLKLGEKLKTYLKLNYQDYQDDLSQIQIKHFQKVIYSPSTLKKRIDNLQVKTTSISSQDDKSDFGLSTEDK